MANQLGALIGAEVARAESDLAALRSRGQAVLTFSGTLVTVLAAIIALAAGKDARFELSNFTVMAAGAALVAFVLATIFVLVMYLPAGVDAASSQDLTEFAKDNWEESSWEQDVAQVLAKYLVSLRSANGRQGTMLRFAIGLEVFGIAAVATAAISLLSQVSA